MASIYNYNSAKHNLYHYTSSPVIDPSNYSNNQQVYGVSYNNQLYINDAEYGFTFSIDFSGLGMRPKGAPAYGFDTYASQGGLPSGVTIGPSGVLYPDSFSFSILSRNGNTSCYYPGCPSGNFTKASNYNYWNNGNFATVLIGPKHFIACQHFVGPGPATVTIKFLGKNNQIYEKTATKVIDFKSIPQILPANYDWPTNSGWDICVFEIADGQEFSLSDLNQVKAYKILNLYGLPTESAIFAVTPQNGILVTKSETNSSFTNNYFSYSSFPNAAYPAGIDSGATLVFSSSLQSYAGDSGTPMLMYVPRLNETCFVYLYAGGNGFEDNFLTPSSPTKQIFDVLKQYISDKSGYDISLVNYYDPPPPPPVPGPEAPYPNNIIINGKEYTLEQFLELIPGKGSTADFIMNLAPGYTYSLALVSYNKYGISKPTYIENIHIPAV